MQLKTAVVKMTASTQTDLTRTVRTLEFFSVLYTFLNICICVKLLYIISANKFCNTIFIVNTMTGLHTNLACVMLSQHCFQGSCAKKELQEQFRLHTALHAYSTVTFLKYTWCVGIDTFISLDLHVKVMTCLWINTSVPYLFQILFLLLSFPQLVVMAVLSLASKV